MITRHQISCALFILSTCAISWLAMMIVHEFGHVVHAWASGGTVTKVVLHPLAISRTDIDPNPRPLFVVWGGPIWGCLFPIFMWLISRRYFSRVAYLFAFFAGFCLVANGAYLGIGFGNPVGDAAVLLQLGTSKWLLLLFGLCAVPGGFWLWHGLGPSFGIGKHRQPVDTPVTYAVLLLTVVIIVIELIFSERL